MDIPSSRLPELQNALSFAEGVLKTIPGFQLEKEDLGVVFSDYVTDILHVDNLQLQLALQQLIDINQKQLDGIYNLPSGANIFVPLEAQKLRPEYAPAGPPAAKDPALIFQEKLSELNALVEQQNKIKYANVPYVDPKMTADITTKMLEDSMKGMPDDLRIAALETLIKNVQESITTNDQESLGPTFFDDFTREMDALRSKISSGGTVTPESIINFINSLFETLGSSLETGIYQAATAPPSQPQLNAYSQSNQVSSLDDTLTKQVLTSQMNTAQTLGLNLAIDYTTTLLLDGRTVANVVKKYLYEDTLRQDSGAPITKRFTIS